MADGRWYDVRYKLTAFLFKSAKSVFRIWKQTVCDPLHAMQPEK